MVPVPETTLITISQNSNDEKDVILAARNSNNNNDLKSTNNNNYQDEMCERLIQVSFAKIVNSKNERGGARLRKNLLILHLLQKARTEQRTRLHVSMEENDNYDCQDTTTLNVHNSIIDNDDDEDVDDFILNISQDNNSDVMNDEMTSFLDTPIDFVSDYNDNNGDRYHGNGSSSLIVEPMYCQQEQSLTALENLFDTSDVILTSSNLAPNCDDRSISATTTTNSSDEETCSDTSSSSSDESDDDVVTLSSSPSCKRKRKLTEGDNKSLMLSSSSIKRTCSSSIADHQLQGLINVFQTNLSGINSLSSATGGKTIGCVTNNLHTPNSDVIQSDSSDTNSVGANNNKPIPTVWELTCVS